jgi:hypothetical protein
MTVRGRSRLIVIDSVRWDMGFDIGTGHAE